MSGIIELPELLKSMSPETQMGEYVFCTVANNYNYLTLKPLATFKESEGITLILPAEQALLADLPFEGKFKQITLTINSSLQAVGLTAAVAGQLAKYGISANVVAAYHHDHIFVPSEKAAQALTALKALSAE